MNNLHIVKIINGYAHLVEVKEGLLNFEHFLLLEHLSKVTSWTIFKNYINKLLILKRIYKFDYIWVRQNFLIFYLLLQIILGPVLLD